MMGDLILKFIGAVAIAVVLIVVGLIASGIASAEITDKRTGKTKKWGKR